MKRLIDQVILNSKFIFESLANSSSDYIFMWDFQHGSYVLSRNMADDFAMEQEGEDFTRKWGERIHRRDIQRVIGIFNTLLEEKKTTVNMEYQALNARGNYIWLNDRATIRYAGEAGEPEIVIGILHNLAFDGTMDTVTGLLKHDKCREIFELNQSSKIGSHGAVMLLGIDDFTNINTMNNHTFGDLVLRTTVQELLNELPRNSSMYRFDGDQFLILAEGATKTGMNNLYKKIKKYTTVSHQINGVPYRFTVSAGIAQYPEDGHSWPEIEKAVSIAMRKAKEAGKNQCIDFGQEMLKEKMYEQMLGQYLADSVENGFRGFHAVYQPVCHVKDLQVKGAEILLRFDTPDGQTISPLEFIPLLEQTRLIHEVGFWVLEEAVKTCKKWIPYIDDFIMNVNVSYIQLRDIEFCSRLEGLLEKYDLDIRHLTLELTESYFITDAPNISASLDRLRELHLQVAMDDFGTGYSSLARLAQFNVDVVKIDRSFIQSLDRRKYNYDFVDSVVRLCHNVGMKVCVEGVETREEQKSICLLNADYIQGFYVSKPVREETFLASFIMKPLVNSNLIVTPDMEFRHSQLVGDREVLLSMMDACPLALNFWNRDMEIIACNAEVPRLFGQKNEEDFKQNFFRFSPEYQEDGQLSTEKAQELIEKAFKGEPVNTYWMHCNDKGERIPVEVDFARIPYMGDYIIASYTRDMRQQKRMEEQARKFNVRMKAILDASPLCLNLWNRQYQNIMCNKEALNLFELKDETEYTEHFDELSPEYQPDGSLSGELAIEKIDEAFEKGRMQFFWMHRKKNGEEIPAEITLVRIEGLGEGNEPLVAGFTRDIRAQIESQKVQERANERIRAVLDSMPLTCLLWTDDLQISDCNQVAVNFFGAKDKNEIITEFDKFMPERQPDGSESADKKSARFREVLENGTSFFEWVYLNNEKEELPCAVNLERLQLEDEKIIAAYSRDLRELYKTLELNDRLTKIAYYDLLTGTASRAKFIEKLGENFEKAGDAEDLALIIFDIDHFKAINDTYGHDAGDMVLRQVAKRIAERLPENGMLGRFGGDEFMIQITGMDSNGLHNLMSMLVNSINANGFVYEKNKIESTVSMGASYKHKGDNTYQDLLKRADKALYLAKENGRNCSKIL